MSIVKTRFAPSPTGYLHIGGARTAIFSWLYARRHNGKFVLRIEDTDTTRSTDESIEQILSALEWLGIDFDEGPYRQTERSDIYATYLDQLLSDGKAYRCTCTKEMLDEKRTALQKAGKKPMYDGHCRDANIGSDCDKPFVVRFCAPKEGETVIEDALRGKVTFKNSELDDMIIARSDGTPTYNFVVVIDDAQMGITDVIRGDDHLPNTPRQAVIYEALGFPLPRFCHVSMILGSDGKRLSKRHGALSVLEYREKGIFPEAFINYMVRLGWSFGDKELFTIDELKKSFSLDNLSKSPARFDEEKMAWVNAEYMRSMPENELAKLVAEGLKAKGITASIEELLPVMEMVKVRSRNVEEMVNGTLYFFADVTEYDQKAAKKFLTLDIAPHMKELASRLESIDFSDKEAIETCFKGLLEDSDIKMKLLAQPVRLATTGGTVSPGLYDLLSALGKSKSIERILAGARYAEGAVVK